MDLNGGAPVRQVSLDRGDGSNSIDDHLLDAIHSALDAAESAPDSRVVVLTGADGVFSTGMSLTGAAREGAAGPAAEQAGGAYFDLLQRFTQTPRIVVSAVDGQVAGGGVGLAAASDLVYATPRSTFALPEALWGLLPCCVLPFLVRRIGFQPAYAMALTTQPVSAQDAATRGLVDQLGPDLAGMVRRLAYRTGKLEPETIGDAKRYAGGLWEVSEQARRHATGELGRLMARPAVRQRLAAFAERGSFPWEG